MCGGTKGITDSTKWAIGLSPRVRGNRFAAGYHCRIVGSIPACAGEPCERPRGRYADEVYPRVCGGTELPEQVVPLLKGLSPRVRGNPEKRLESRPELRVYPRVCGGTNNARSTEMDNLGLSPRVRGNPLYWRIYSARSGSIPACAGEPAPVR